MFFNERKFICICTSQVFYKTIVIYVLNDHGSDNPYVLVSASPISTSRYSKYLWYDQ